MRAIEFRAWDKIEKKMIPAEAWYFSDEFEPFVDSVKKAQEDFEIMQFTGLHDRDGKKIFEGDIIKFKHGIGEVYYKEDEATFCHTFIENLGYIRPSKRLWLTENYPLEVIGNIFEHPNLLEVKDV